MTKMTIDEIGEFERLNRIVKAGFKNFIQTGLALIRIHDGKLYRRDWLTWEIYLQRELGITTESARQTMKAVAVVQRLAGQNPNSSCDLVITKKAALELGKAPEEQRPSILKSVSKNGPPTVASVRAAVEKSKAKEATVCDDSPERCEIPPEAMEFWNRKDEIQGLMTAISKVKTYVQSQQDNPMFSSMGNIIVANLSQSYHSISNIKPYAVCTQCQGRFDANKGGCGMCHNTGLISKFLYETASCKETKEIRHKQMEARS